MKELLAKLPKIDGLMARPEIQELAYPRWAVVEASRREVERLRKRVLDGEMLEPVDVARIGAAANTLTRSSLRPVVNATGVVLHTNLGRAPLSARALERVAVVAGGYSNLEFDLDEGRRGSRHSHLTATVQRLLGAEDAVIVNNNAAAVMLALAALAEGREVIVSRGELVEIGGSFRVPDVMRMSGAILREVGTTNKTRADDYRNAVTKSTALLLKVHQANFEIVGFTEETTAKSLAALGRDAGVPTMMDLGSGSLLSVADLASVGLAGEPTPAETLAAGIDVVTFSGDKLLGGPQAGIIAGRADLVAKARTHPLMRALRPDKMTIAALDATLSDFRDETPDAVPAHSMLSANGAELESAARALHQRLSPPEGLQCVVVACSSTVGGGAKPGSALPSWAVGLSSAAVSADEIARRLRLHDPPIIGRVHEGRVLLDLRTLFRTQDRQAVASAVNGFSAPGVGCG